jgi:multicomponent Na+:H+ antiporter subunit D
MTPDPAVAAAGLVVPPWAVLILAGLTLAVVRGLARDMLILGAPVAAMVLVWTIPEGVSVHTEYMGMELALVRTDSLSRLFATVFTLMAFAGGLYALRQERRAELAAAYVYAGAALGAVLAGDLITLFVFWEVMAVASTLVIWMGGDRARRSGMRYVYIHLLGGVVLMAGIAGHLALTGSIAFDSLIVSPAKWLILSGFLLNAGAPPLSAWLPDAYPEASWSGTVFLSAFTTKTAVYVLLRGFAGEPILIWIGLFMAFYGIVYAILENDMRRILAYSIVNQVGFMVTGIGIGTEMALNGAAAHAFVHIIYKALLLMSAGSVLLMTGRRKCSELGGLFRTMPVTTVCGIVGALSISAFPLTSGFVAKSMISEGAIGRDMEVVWFLLTAASAGVFLHAGIKFPWFVFFQKDSGLRPPDPPWPMQTAMVLLAVLCVAIGVAPGALFAILPYAVDFVPYTGPHVVSQLQLLLFSGLAFFLLLGWLRRTDTITLDADWLWRRFGRSLARAIDGGGSKARLAIVRRGQDAADRAMRIVYRHHGPSGVLARSWPTGSMAIWATLLLAAYLVLYYL